MVTVGALIGLTYQVAIIIAIGCLARLSVRLAALAVELWSMDATASQSVECGAPPGGPGRQNGPEAVQSAGGGLGRQRASVGASFVSERRFALTVPWPPLVG